MTSTMFWGFFFRLMVGSVLAPIAFSFMLVPFIALMALTARGDRSKLAPLAYPVIALAVFAQVYFWGMWAAVALLIGLLAASAADSQPPANYFSQGMSTNSRGGQSPLKPPSGIGRALLGMSLAQILMSLGVPRKRVSPYRRARH